MRFDTKDRTPGREDRRFEHVPKRLLWCVCRAQDNTGWKWNSGHRANKLDCLMTLIYMLQASQGFLFAFSLPLSIEHWAGGVEWTAADVWALLYVLVLVCILVFIALKLMGVLVETASVLQPLSLFTPCPKKDKDVLPAPPPLSPCLFLSDCSLTLLSPFCRHQLQSCWLTSDPIDLI